MTFDVSQPAMPRRAVLDRYLDTIYENRQLTNHGPLVQTLTERLEDYLGVRNLLLVANGTLALQVALKALDVHRNRNASPRNVVTTPFTFAATARAIEWEGLTPQYADIDERSFNITATGIDTNITDASAAILPVHVFGNPCDTDSIDRLGRERGLPVVYDAAHAFAVRRDGTSVLSAGDASTLSFHATKVFHTAEGGGVVFRSPDALAAAREIINFGLRGADKLPAGPGINAKLSEVHAAIGLAILDDMDDILEQRRERLDAFYAAIPQDCPQQEIAPGTLRNAAYLPVQFPTPAQRQKSAEALATAGFKSRRYFYPSLAGDARVAPRAASLAERILCLPLHHEMPMESVRSMAGIVSREMQPGLATA